MILSKYFKSVTYQSVTRSHRRIDLRAAVGQCHSCAFSCQLHQAQSASSGERHAVAARATHSPGRLYIAHYNALTVDMTPKEKRPGNPKFGGPPSRSILRES